MQIDVKNSMKRFFKYVTPIAFGLWIIAAALIIVSVIHSANGLPKAAVTCSSAAMAMSFLGVGVNQAALTARRLWIVLSGTKMRGNRRAAPSPLSDRALIPDL
jgi:hypothetical protein